LKKKGTNAQWERENSRGAKGATVQSWRPKSKSNRLGFQGRSLKKNKAPKVRQEGLFAGKGSGVTGANASKREKKEVRSNMDSSK